jgi:hypothetical protein
MAWKRNMGIKSPNKKIDQEPQQPREVCWRLVQLPLELWNELSQLIGVIGQQWNVVQTHLC